MRRVTWRTSANARAPSTSSPRNACPLRALPADATIARMSRFSNTELVPLARVADGDIDHGSGQVVGPNHLVGKQQPKRRVDRAQQAVAEIRFLPRLDRVDVRGAEDVQAREPCRVRAPSRPRPCSARTPADCVLSGPRRSRSRMKTRPPGCCRGALARTQPCSPR